MRDVEKQNTLADEDMYDQRHDDGRPPYAVGGYIPGPHIVTASLPPEPPEIARLRRALATWSVYADDWRECTSASNEEVINAAEALIMTFDEQRAAQAQMISSALVAEMGRPALEKLREMTGRAAVADPDHPSASDIPAHPNWVSPEGIDVDPIAP